MYDNYYGVDSFFSTQTCDRCGRKLTGRTMSWFNTDTICMKCVEEEKKLCGKAGIFQFHN